MKKYLFLLLIIANSVNAQNQVTGKVLSAKDKVAISGAIVEVIGLPKSIQTNSSGLFSTNLAPGTYQVTVKFLGYLTKDLKITVPLERELLIYLDDNVNEIEEVTINTGYQTISRERATGSVTHIDNKKLNTLAGSNVLSRLDGIASGVMFDTKSSTSAQRRMNFNVRGLSSITGQLDPLIVVDDFPYEGDINNIDPNDVESITILKDAAAASIWGARAGNGVVVITTKKGKFNQEINTSFRTTHILTDKPDYFKISQISSSDFIDVEEMLFSKGYYNSTINNQPQVPLTPAVQVFLDRRNKVISSADSTLLINQMKGQDIRDDYTKYFLRQPLQSQYYASIMGGTQKNSFAASAGYTNTIGELGTGDKKVNLNFSNSFKPLNGTSIDFNINYTNSNGIMEGLPALTGLRINNKTVPYLNLVNDNGIGLAVPLNVNTRYLNDLGNDKLLSWDYVPFEDHKNNKSERIINNLVTNVGVKQRLTEWLSLQVKYQNEFQTSIYDQMYGENGYFARYTVNNFTQIQPTTGVLTYNIPQGGILNKTEIYIKSNNFRSNFDVKKTFSKGELYAIVGGEIRSTSQNSMVSRRYGFREDPLQSSNVDLVNRFSTILNGFLNIEAINSLTNTLRRFASVFGNANYVHNRKYMLSGSFRKDASNVFGLSTNDKWNPLWSLGTSWDIGKEDFYTFEWIPTLKLRATYGYQGNVDVTKSAIVVMGTTSNNTITGFPQARISQIGNPDLRWETIGQLNLAVDFEIKNAILSGTLEYYRKKGRDMYGPELVDYTAWVTGFQQTRNMSGLRGDGIELVLNSRNLRKELTWNTNLIFNFNRTITTDYLNPIGYTGGVINVGSNITPVIGKPLYGIGSYKWAGLDAQGNPQGYLNGVKSVDYNAIINDLNRLGFDSDAMVFHGSSQPLYFGSIANSFGFKNFNLSFSLSYKLGYFFRKNMLSYGGLFQSGSNGGDFSKRWQAPGDELKTHVPSMQYPNVSQRDAFYGLSEVSIDRGDHIRLQYVNFSYTPKFKKREGSTFKNLNVYLYVGNPLLVWTRNKERLDPDYPNSLAPSKNYTLGFTTNF